MKRTIKRILLYTVAILIGLFILLCGVIALISVEQISFSGGTGPSMLPTLKEGQWTMDQYRLPKEGEIVGLVCISRCEQPNQPLQKRVIHIDDKGCYWLEGDNKSNSYDSKYFGWLCPEDVTNISTVIAILPFYSR
jgi:hypothetical protein